MTAIIKKPYYDAFKVREAATGRWLEVLTYLASDQLSDALNKPGKHVTCPIHGTNRKGRGDGFRLFKDVVNTGGGVCNTCGIFSDGFELLHWLKGWDFRTALAYVAEVLHVPPEKSNAKSRKQRPIQSVPQGTKQSGSERKEALSENPQSVEKTVVPIFQPTPERLEEIKAMQTRLSERVAKEAVHAKEKIDRVWYESISLADGVPGPLFRYWEGRGILLRKDVLVKGDSVRFHPELPYFDEDENGKLITVGKFPAMISAIRDLEGNIVTLHRTYLTKAGKKAKVECPRKMMTVPGDKTIACAAIQLGGFPTDGVMGIAEGIETAMSAMRVYKMPTWSLVSANMLEQFEPPKGVRTILIWADKDKSFTGQRSAQALKDTLEPRGIAVHVLLPQRPIKGKSIDWNDVLVNEGRWGFPAREVMRQFFSEGAVCAF